MSWFRWCRRRNDQCGDLRRKLSECEKIAEDNLTRAQNAEIEGANLLKERDEACKAAVDHVEARQKAEDERDELQRRLDDVIEVAQGRKKIGDSDE